VPGDGWCFVGAVAKLSNDYGAARALKHRSTLI